MSDIYDYNLMNKIYINEKHKLIIKFINNEIIINITDKTKNIYEVNVNIENYNLNCLSNYYEKQIEYYFMFLTNAFENINNNYDIVIS